MSYLENVIIPIRTKCNAFIVQGRRETENHACKFFLIHSLFLHCECMNARCAVCTYVRKIWDACLVAYSTFIHVHSFEEVAINLTTKTTNEWTSNRSAIQKTDILPVRFSLSINFQLSCLNYSNKTKNKGWEAKNEQIEGNARHTRSKQNTI